MVFFYRKCGTRRRLPVTVECHSVSRCSRRAHELQFLVISLHKLSLLYQIQTYSGGALSCSNYIFNFPTKFTGTIEYLYCSLNICCMFRPSLRHHQPELFIASQNNVTMTSCASTALLSLSEMLRSANCLYLLCRKNEKEKEKKEKEERKEKEEEGEV